LEEFLLLLLSLTSNHWHNYVNFLARGTRIYNYNRRQCQNAGARKFILGANIHTQQREKIPNSREACVHTQKRRSFFSIFGRAHRHGNSLTYLAERILLSFSRRHGKYVFCRTEGDDIIVKTSKHCCS